MPLRHCVPALAQRRVSYVHYIGVYHTLSCCSQRIFLVRHGESEYNAACKGQQNFWDVDNIFDARLTRIGKKQVGYEAVGDTAVPRRRIRHSVGLWSSTR